MPDGVPNACTVTTALIGVPLQLAVAGVMVYVTVPVASAVVVRVCTIDVPLPLDAPDTPEALTVQLKVVPETPFGLVMLIDVACPEHNVCPEADTSGTA